MAMFMVRNDLPLPGLNEVMMMTFEVLSLPVINSRLVRNTRNASLMMSRLPSLTTTALTSCGFFPNILFFFLVNSGISPMNGTVTLSRSFLPRTRVFIFSRMKIMTIGMSSPRNKCDHKDVLAYRGCRQHTAVRWSDNAGIIGRKCLRVRSPRVFAAGTGKEPPLPSAGVPPKAGIWPV